MEDYLKPKLSDGEMEGFSVLALAYLGDGVFELMARTHLALSGSITAYGMHRKTVKIVCAGAQAKAARLLQKELTGEELSVFLRGRNAKPKTLPKHADRADYSYATALETLFGWLFLKGNAERMNELFYAALKAGTESASKGGRTD